METAITVLFALVGLLFGILIGGFIGFKLCIWLMTTEEVQEIDSPENTGLPTELQQIFKGAKVMAVNPENGAQDIMSIIKGQNANEMGFLKGTANIAKNSKELTIDAFRENLEKEIDNLMKAEDFLAVNRFQDVINKCEEWFEERKSWFASMVGKKIYPDRMNCPCDGCEEVLKNGVEVENESHAMSMFMHESVSRTTKTKITYSEEKL